MTDRTDSPPTGPDSERPGSDRMASLSVAEAAARLGVTPDAVRARLHRGTLAGEKIDGTWQVYLLAQTDRQDMSTGTTVQQDADRHRQAISQQEATGMPTASPVDLTPLVAELHDLRVELQRVTEAAGAWQVRALRAEAQLKQLTEGDVPSAPPVESEEATTLGPQRPFWQRLFRTWTGLGKAKRPG